MYYQNNKRAAIILIEVCSFYQPMSALRVIIFYFFILTFLPSFAQDEFICTKEGQSILNRRQLIANCLKNLNKDKTDEKSLPAGINHSVCHFILTGI